MAHHAIRFNPETDSYREFIHQLRNRARDGNQQAQGRPLLPQEPENIREAETFDFELVGYGAAITVRVRRFDLYLIGFRDSSGRWREFGRANEGRRRLIDGSEFFGFTERYEDLGGLDRESWNVGYTEFMQAIKDIALNNVKKLRAAIRLVAVMVSEAARCEHFLDSFADLMEANTSAAFETWMELAIHAWTDVSTLLCRLQFQQVPFSLPRQNNGSENILSQDSRLHIRTATNATECYAILRRRRNLDRLLLLSEQPTTDPSLIVLGAAGAGMQGRGSPMVEVFSVRVNDIDGESPGDLYGTVQVSDGLGSFYIYNRGRGDSEPVYPDGTASLTGPYRAISFGQYFRVSLDLVDKDEDASPDDEVSKGSFSWELSEFLNHDLFDKRLFEFVRGRYGSVNVYYTVFSDAVQASVEVMLINGDDEDPAEVYGTVVAYYDGHDYSSDEQKRYYRTTLFSRASNQYVQVSPGQLIPLSRSVVAVPTSSPLVIEADLWDEDTAKDDEIAKGRVVFPPQAYDQAKGEIRGRYGAVQVTVSWTPMSSY